MYFQVLVRDILEGQVLENDFMLKSGIKTRFVAIVGYPVRIEERRKFVSIYINDGTGTIELRVFDNIDINKNKPYLILGTIREFKGKIYIAPKFLVQLKNDKQYQVFRLNIIYRYLVKNIKFELPEEKEVKETKIEKESTVPVSDKFSDIIEIRRLIIKLIDDLDEGSGVSVEELYELVGKPKRELFERVIQELLMTGEIYEPEPGKLKLLKEV